MSDWRGAHYRGGKLKCKFVIHTVGPNCQSGYSPDIHDALLAAAYRNSLALVAERGLKSVSFPSISTGIYSFPHERAVKIAAAEIAAFLASHPDVTVRICLLGHDADETKALYEQAFAAAMPCVGKPSRKRPRSDVGFMDSEMLAIVDYTSIKHLGKDGRVEAEENFEFYEPEEDRIPHAEGTSWHPILQRYLPNDVVNMPILTEEKHIFPNEVEE